MPNNHSPDGQRQRGRAGPGNRCNINLGGHRQNPVMGPRGPFELKIGMMGQYWMSITKMKAPSDNEGWGEGVVVTASKYFKMLTG